MIYNREKHHRRSVRLKGYDYSGAGAYFVTICARNRECIFTDIKTPVGATLAVALNAPAVNVHVLNSPAMLVPPPLDPVLQLTTIGKIIDANWKQIPYEYANVEIDEFIIMPNHFHGIIVVNCNTKAIAGVRANTKEKATASKRANARKRTTARERATARVAPTVGNIIGAFKSRCVTDYLNYIRKNNVNDIAKIWQRNYHDRIIRNEKELHKIRQYIRNNPLQWDNDDENPVNVRP